MRILYHHRTLGDGAEGIHINQVVNAFRCLGHDVRVVALVGEQPHSGNDTALPRAQRQWSTVGSLLPGVLYELAEIGYNLIGRRKIQRAIRDFKPDFVYDRYNSFSSAAVEAARKCGIPVFVEVNAPVAYERVAYERRRLRLKRLAAWYERRICNRADHVFAVSTPLKDFLIHERSVPESNITVLPNGADPTEFDPSRSTNGLKQRLGIGGKTVIGFVGILRPWHGVELLLEAFQTLAKRWPSIHLLIVGDGTIEQSIKNQVQLLGLSSSVTFTGRVAHSDVVDYIAAMDIAISPRATFYASPMKILEYMAMAVATVAPDMANIRDIICNGENGLLFQPDDCGSMVEAIETLLTSPEFSERIRKNARLTIESRRNWMSIARDILERASTCR